jgi:teichuronic acid biosynthesis glycosyltransferase TuaC
VTEKDAAVPILCRIGAGSVERAAAAPTGTRVPPVRVLVVTNMYPTPRSPGRGPFVRDQVEALRRRGDVDVELYAFGPGPRALAGAAVRLRRRFGRRRFDVVHAHFGLTAWPALLAGLGPVVVTLHGNDLLVRRSYLVTRAALPFVALTTAVSREFSRNVPGAGATRRVAILPVGIDVERFRPIPRAQARARLGLDPQRPYVLFPHDPARPLKRYDRAQAAAGDASLLTLGGVAAEDVPYWINAANAVLVPSQEEGFGLAVLEALACGVPPLATPVGIHPVALSGIPGAYCGVWDAAAWRAALQPHLAAADPRVDGRARAELFSADAMAARVVEAWRALLAEPDLYSKPPHERTQATPNPPARR